MRNGLQKYLILLVIALTGTVIDLEGAVVAGAAVTVTNNATETNGEGTFTAHSLIAGVYTATVATTGFKQAVVTEIKGDVGKSSATGLLSVNYRFNKSHLSVSSDGGDPRASLR